MDEEDVLRPTSPQSSHHTEHSPEASDKEEQTNADDADDVDEDFTEEHQEVDSPLLEEVEGSEDFAEEEDHTAPASFNMASSKQEQARVSSLLLDTVALLCKNGLTYRREMKIQGTLGITLDDDSVFVVQINESVADPQTPKRSTSASSSAVAAGGSARQSERSNLRKRQADFSPSTRAPADKRRSEVIVIGDSDPPAPVVVRPSMRGRGRGRAPRPPPMMTSSPRARFSAPNTQQVKSTMSSHLFV